MTITNHVTDHDAELAELSEDTEEYQAEPDEAAEDSDEAPELFYANAEDWVHGWFLPHFRRNPNTMKWRADWWRIEEIQLIMESLWETWEYYRQQPPTGNIVFLRDYFYPMMDIITSPEGPLWNYDPPRDEEIPAKWSATTAPAGMFRERGHPEDD